MGISVCAEKIIKQEAAACNEDGEVTRPGSALDLFEKATNIVIGELDSCLLNAATASDHTRDAIKDLRADAKHAWALARGASLALESLTQEKEKF